MKRRPTFWIGAIFAFFLAYRADAETPVEASLQALGDEWAEAFYHLPPRQQVEKFQALLPRLHKLAELYPKRAEPLILQAVVLCTYAAADWGFSSLSRLREARELLIKSIDLDPKAMEATAFITLGNLYYRLPGWPISFGDEALALQYLEYAIKLYPKGLDSNYFLGDYWLQEGDYDKALAYFETADQAPVRPYQRLSDEKIKEQLRSALDMTRKRQRSHGDFFSSLIPSSFRDNNATAH